MKRQMPYLINCLALLLGAFLLAFPTYSNNRYQEAQIQIIESYTDTLKETQGREYAAMRARAEEYNALLTGQGIKDPFVPGSGIVLPKDYEEILNIDGIMGTVDIPAISTTLAVYHGTSDEVLNKGVGHLEATSLPVGGETTHSVLTAHSGRATAKLFTDLNLLEIGDTFYLHILDEILAYEVDQILVVRPDETDALRPVRGEDYVTLLTCTPYGINSHRLFVRGHRVPYELEVYQQQAVNSRDKGIYIPWQYLVSGIAVVGAAISFTGLLAHARHKQKKELRKAQMKKIWRMKPR